MSSITDQGVKTHAVPPATRPRLVRLAYWAAVATLLGAHALLATLAIPTHNICIDEGGHLYSGVVMWQEQNVGLYHVNPPLIKALVALPVMASGPSLPPSELPRYTLSWLDPHQRFLEANHGRNFELLCRARGVLVLLSLLGGWIVFRWSRELYGPAAGLIGLALWALSPNVLAWSGVITTDLGAAVFALAAAHAIGAWLRRRSPLDAAWAGLMVGLAVLSKFSLMVIYPVLLTTWVAAEFLPGRMVTARTPGRLASFGQVCLIVAVSVVAINAAYGFDRSFRPLGEFEFRSAALTRPSDDERVNRFAGTLAGSVPVPLPDVFLLGVDTQKALEEAPGRTGYLQGVWKAGGWYHYYAYGLLVKIPLGTLAISALAAALAVASRRYRVGRVDELLVWLPPLSIFALISMHTGVNSHFRYALPALGFAFVGVSRVGMLISPKTRPGGDAAGPASEGGYERTPEQPPARRPAGLVPAGVVTLLLAWNAYSVASLHPHYISYFNALAGGPDSGWKHLIYSNIDWGQDLYHLKSWMADHPDASPLHIGFFGGAAPSEEDVRGPLPSPGPVPGIDSIGAPAEYTSLSPSQLGPRPGWYAVSANVVAGMSLPQVGRGGERIQMPRGAYTYFQQFEPVGKAGYSIFIYHITLDEANAVRQDLGLPALPAQ